MQLDEAAARLAIETRVATPLGFSDAAGLDDTALPQVIIPPEPGIFSALGMILADARWTRTRTFLRDLAPESLVDIETIFATMTEHACPA